jgi:thymidine kinase
MNSSSLFPSSYIPIIPIVCKPVTGRLELIIGPMFASKSTELIRIASRYKSIGKKIMAINHTYNNRYGTTNISSHDHNILNDCIVATNLAEIIENADNRRQFEEADVIVIEELQFFADAYQNIIEWVDQYHKIIIAAGLSGDYRRESFGDIYRLIPHAEDITKLSAYCSICRDGTLGHFTQRFTEESDRTLVGSSDKYRAVCRYHFNTSGNN